MPVVHIYKCLPKNLQSQLHTLSPSIDYLSDTHLPIHFHTHLSKSSFISVNNKFCFHISIFLKHISWQPVASPLSVSPALTHAKWLPPSRFHSKPAAAAASQYRSMRMTDRCSWLFEYLPLLISFVRSSFNRRSDIWSKYIWWTSESQ